MTYNNIPKRKKIENKIPLSGTKRKKIEIKIRLLVKWCKKPTLNKKV